MDKIIVDIEPSEATECVELLRRVGYDAPRSGYFDCVCIEASNRRIYGFGSLRIADFEAEEVMGDSFPITMPELREVVKLHYNE